MADPLLRVEGLRKRFGAVQASHDVNLSVAAGEIHALIGPNGAGKTTVLNQLTGEIEPDEGRIVFEGRDITGLPIHQRVGLGLARSYQITSIFERLTVRQNLALSIQARIGHSFRFWKDAGKDPEILAQMDSALARVGLTDRADLPAGNLSHGEKRQLDVGMALAGNPKLLLLDEPYAGMGPGGAVELTKLIRSLKGELTILLVEHDMNVVFSLADRITVLVYGETFATGPPEEIRANPEVRRAYLGEEDDGC
ncbi:MAG: ABC transporter ATP-binding protein [Desulfococcaceae bacterium]